MPQLMPLNWVLSFFMILFIISMMVLIYDCVFKKMLINIFINTQKPMNNWKWW